VNEVQAQSEGAMGGPFKPSFGLSGLRRGLTDDLDESERQCPILVAKNATRMGH